MVVGIWGLRAGGVRWEGMGWGMVEVSVGRGEVGRGEVGRGLTLPCEALRFFREARSERGGCGDGG